jgi:hypothetical protein
MTEESHTSVFESLMSDFRAAQYELLNKFWCECALKGFDQPRVERALISIALEEVFDLAAESMGPAACAELICVTANERLESHRHRR